MSSLPELVDPPASVFHGHVLRSAFQPIFSFSHQRLIGHEALLRATDCGGHAVAPNVLFERCLDVVETKRLDQACSLLHIQGFARAHEPAQWLFLNVDASAFAIDGRRRASPAALLLALVEEAGLMPGQLVIELLEAALPKDPQVERWTDELKSVGFNVALDDFGAGHSNFDRVFRLRPHIVKLDRSVIASAATDSQVRRVMAQMISLLHECGTQVLIEGVESADEAIIALDADADFVQGYYFGRPQARLRRSAEPSDEMARIWAGCDARSRRDEAANAARLEPYATALLEARRLMEAGRPITEACQAFVPLDHADRCYVLDGNGLKAAQRVFRPRADSEAGLADKFAPLLDVRGSRWSRRPYFRQAIAAPGKLCITRPYPTIHGPIMTVTLSITLTIGDRLFVLCGDKVWRPDLEHASALDRPDPEAAGDESMPWRAFETCVDVADV